MVREAQYVKFNYQSKTKVSQSLIRFYPKQEKPKDRGNLTAQIRQAAPAGVKVGQSAVLCRAAGVTMTRVVVKFGRSRGGVGCSKFLLKGNPLVFIPKLSWN